MMKVKLAKSLMENEEGTNHLWIEIPTSVANTAQIDLYLPKGVSRSKNLNGYYEDESGTIFIDNFSKTLELVIEIFTQEPIPCGDGTICVDLKYKDKQDQSKKINHCFPLSIVNDDEMNHLVIDNDVIDSVKKLIKGDNHNEDKDTEEREFVIVPPVILNVNRQISELEKKYRVDFRF